MKKEAFYDEKQYSSAEFEITISDSKGEKFKHQVDEKTYWSFNDKLGRLYGKRVRFQTVVKRSVSGILEDVTCILIPRKES